MSEKSSRFTPIVPSSGVALPEIDGLRALAAMNVLACHAMVETRWGPPWIVPLFEGAIGVELFFVLSGFLLFLPFVRAHDRGERIALGPYALRRVLRILPAYYVNLALCILFLWPEGMTTRHGVATILAHLTLTFSVSESMVHAINPVYWTLCVEEQFYLLLPLCAALFTGKRGALWLILSLPIPNLVVTAWRARFGAEGVSLVATLPYHWTAFGLGMLIAKEFERGRPVMPQGERTAPSLASFGFVAAGILGLVGAVGARPVAVYQPQFLQGQAVAWALVLGSVLVGPRWLGAPLRWKPVRVLGLMTFSIYLWHMTVVERIMSLSDPPHDWPSAIVRLVTVFALTLPFAAGSYLLVERPFMELRRRLERADVTAAASGVR